MSKMSGAVALVGCALLAGQDASACYNETLRMVDPAVAKTVEAERLVDAGNTRDAKLWIKSANPVIAKNKLGASPLSDRGLSVLARAALRSGGSDYLGHASEAPSLEEKAVAIGWARDIARSMRERQPSDPHVASLFAESLAADPADLPRVLEVLEPLEKADVLPSPYGYAALAKARDRSAATAPGFVRGPLAALSDGKRQLALARCERMAKDAAICHGTVPARVAPNGAGVAAVQRENAWRRRINDTVVRSPQLLRE